MHEIRKLPTASLRAPSRHPSSAPNHCARQETMPNLRSAESDRIRHNATGYDRAQRKLVPARAHARVRGNGVPFPFPRAQGAADFWSCRPRAVMPIDRTKPLEQNR